MAVWPVMTTTGCRATPAELLDLACRVRAADRAGELDTARELAECHMAATADADAGLLAESFLLKAKVLRHRDDHASLLEACDAAGHAMRLGRTRQGSAQPLLSERAVLEHAACLLATERASTARDAAMPLVDHEDADVSARAWWLVGRSWFNVGEAIQAVASLQNAAAEVRRNNKEGESLDKLVRSSLAAALDEAGRVDAAGWLLQEDQSWWADRRGCGRARSGYHITAARNLHRRGNIAGALDELDRAEEDLASCNAVSHLVAAVHRVRAECLDDRGQGEAAMRHALKARTLLRRITAEPRRVSGPPVVETMWVPGYLDAGTDHVSTTTVGGAHRNRLRLAEATVTRLAGAATDPQLPQLLADGHTAAAVAGELGVAEVVRLWTYVEMVLNGAQAGGVSGESDASRLAAVVQSLQGVAGAEGHEAEALCRAGGILARVEGERRSPWTERLLWRGVVRAESLPGAGLLQASAEIALARLMHSDQQQRDDDALELSIRGLQRLHSERLTMRHRGHRRTWLEAEINPATELAIELALQCERQDLARDLVVFSRAGGVTLPEPKDPSGTWHGSDVPLAPIPTVHYIDGTTSSMGVGGKCHFR